MRSLIQSGVFQGGTPYVCDEVGDRDVSAKQCVGAGLVENQSAPFFDLNFVRLVVGWSGFQIIFQLSASEQTGLGADLLNDGH